MRLAQIFQTHAVLQRDIPIPIWGEAAPGTRVTVTLGPHTATAKTGSDGRWLLRLPSLPAGGPHTLAATAEGQAPIILDDLLIGEVWIASGQSNMEFSLSSALPDDDPSSITKLPHLRLFSIGTLPTPEKQTSLDGRWQAADPHTLGTFSAVAGWFGRTLQTRLDVPVGIIVNALGGTRIQAWLSREALMLDPSTRNEIAPYEALLHSPELPDTPTYTSTDDWFRNAGPETPGNPGLRDGWAAPDFDDSAWGLLPIPSHWQDHGHDFNGILWFRRRIQLPTEWRGQPLIPLLVIIVLQLWYKLHPNSLKLRGALIA